MASILLRVVHEGVDCADPRSWDAVDRLRWLPGGPEERPRRTIFEALALGHYMQPNGASVLWFDLQSPEGF